jgi:hypothetical protein
MEREARGRRFSLLRKCGQEGVRSDVWERRASFFRFGRVVCARMRWLGNQPSSQPSSAEHVPHAFQVVDHRRQADLALGSGESAQQESRGAEDAVLQRRKRMLHGRSSQPHHLGRSSGSAFVVTRPRAGVARLDDAHCSCSAPS